VTLYNQSDVYRVTADAFGFSLLFKYFVVFFSFFQASDADFGIDKVEFLIDDAVTETVTDAPYTWRWSTPALFLHTIEVVAHNNDGATKSDELSVWKFF